MNSNDKEHKHGMLFTGAIERVNDIHDNGTVNVSNYYAGERPPQETYSPQDYQPKNRPMSLSEKAKRVTQAIRRLQEEQTNGEYLMEGTGHWAAIYAVLIDHGFARVNDYSGFREFVATFLPQDLRIPYNYEAMKKTIQNSGTYHHAFSNWRPDKFSGKSTKPFYKMLAVGEAFQSLLNELEV